MCYANTWNSESKRLSDWNKNNGMLLKHEIITAFKMQTPEAIGYLFGTSNKEELTNNYRCPSTWSYCSSDIENEAKWFCPQADNGIADSQRRIADIFYFNSETDEDNNLLRAYVWYTRAASGNNTIAKQRLLEIKEKLSAEQIKDMQLHIKEVDNGQCKRDLIEAGLL